jgi:hypothetical protein
MGAAICDCVVCRRLFKAPPLRGEFQNPQDTGDSIDCVLSNDRDSRPRDVSLKGPNRMEEGTEVPKIKSEGGDIAPNNKGEHAPDSYSCRLYITDESVWAADGRGDI